jgi:hypothetical protein
MSAPDDLDSLIRNGANRFGNAFLIDDNRSETPVWFDSQRFEAGRDFFRRHVLSVSFGYFCSLYVGFTVDALSKAVTYTGESETADRSRHRYLNTMGHLYSWHTSNVIEDEASIGYRSVRYVRSWHDRVRKRMAAKMEASIDQHLVSQYDTAVVQIGFVAPIISYPRQFGIRCSNDEIGLANYVYFWRVIGYVLGLEDPVNACGHDLRTSKKIAKEIEQRIIVPGLRNPTPAFLILSETLIDGYKVFWPWLTSKIIRGYVYPLMGLPTPSDLSWKEYVILKLLNLHFYFMYLVPWYASYWNRKVFKMMEKLLPTVVPS